ncbi:MAG: aminotransferase class V-fold PLP-dependent enzyme [Cytophagales bacterium]|nr:aminotransferase class V-fold PLP-dependent enzyme [Cytophagales bacterium]
MDRRRFIQNSGFALGASMLPVACTTVTESAPAVGLETWDGVRSQFLLSPRKIHMSQMLLASHPLPVREAIDMHRKNFDENPVEYWEANWTKAEVIVQEAVGRYVQCAPEEVALTDSTTMGLALLYNGLRLKAGDEILTSTHDHYATEKSLEFAVARNGATLRRIKLYENPAAVSVDEVVNTVRKAIQPKTRIVALTWVHSGTGVKLPIRAIADAIAEVNKERTGADRIYFCVDGVHGFGIDNIAMADLGCDFFAAGTHKWIFGPRGTGILFGKKDAWDMMGPTIPAFSFNAYGAWLGLYGGKVTFGDEVSPGGFHSFESRWALNTAFDFQMKIGKARVAQRTVSLGTQLKEGLSEIKHVTLHTPMNPALSAGINCFEVKGMSPTDVVAKLLTKGIIASVTPYKTEYARLTPSIVNNEEEVTTAIRALENINA